MSKEKTRLIEKALSAYKEHLEFQRKKEREETQKFMEGARKEFIQRFETEPEKITAVSPNECYIECDGLRFRAVETREGFRIYVLLKCEKCQRTIEEWVTSLLSLGAVLTEPHICFECREAELIGKEERR